MVAQMASQFGNSVNIPADALPNNETIVTVFDTGTVPISDRPQMVTVDLSIDTPNPIDDRVWAIIEAGCGGSSRTFSVDWERASQLAFPADRVRVDLRRVATIGSVAFKARACVGVGARSVSSLPPTWTTDVVIIPAAGSTLVLDAPPHAKSFSIITDDLTIVGKGLRIVQQSYAPDWNMTLTDAEYRDVLLGKLELPVVAPQQTFENTLGGGTFVRVRYYLDL